MVETYVITGIGLYNGLGPTTESSWAQLLAGNTTIQEIEWPADDATQFPNTYKHLKVKKGGISPAPLEGPERFSRFWKDWDPNTRTGMLTVDEAVTKSRINPKNTGVIFSTFGAGTTIRLGLFTAINNGQAKYSPRKCLNIGLDFPAAQIAAIYGSTGPNLSLDSACTTGLAAIDQAIATLKAYPELDAMIVGAADRMFEPIYTYWFQCLGALSLTGESKPFDVDRNGFVLGEGAATLVIEPLSKARARGANIYGTIMGAGFTTMFASDTSPDPEGNGARACMNQAIARSGIRGRGEITYVNAHATGTPIGDQIEYDAIATLLPGATVVSNKGQIGHCMAPAGLIETAYTLLAMRDGMTPGNANLTNSIGDWRLTLPTTATKMDIKYAIKNSFGFGGRNISIVLGRYDD